MEMEASPQIPLWEFTDYSTLYSLPRLRLCERLQKREEGEGKERIKKLDEGRGEENKWCKKHRKEREGKEEKGRCPPMYRAPIRHGQTIAVITKIFHNVCILYFPNYVECRCI